VVAGHDQAAGFPRLFQAAYLNAGDEAQQETHQ
jgi:hypothetical protein